MRFGSTPPGRGRAGEASRWTLDTAFSTTPLKNDSSTRWMFSSASSTEKRGSTPRKSAASPCPGVQIDQEHLVLRIAAKRRCRVDGQRRGADAALGADEGKYLSGLPAAGHSSAPGEPLRRAPWRTGVRRHIRSRPPASLRASAADRAKTRRARRRRPSAAGGRPPVRKEAGRGRARRRPAPAVRRLRGCSARARPGRCR